ncbi:LysR substrate-binding domain-containing protein [Novosphingobium resinovorum]|uniref:LysR substrate-binding domain-containing protein n=1 Tax=Novosphingobium resinovorum TaxID=158500 RepID=UPI003D26AEAD
MATSRSSHSARAALRGRDPSQLKVSLRSSSINSQYAMVSGGAGIGILPCFIGDVRPGLSRIVPECSLERAFWLVTHRETQQLAKSVHSGPGFKPFSTAAVQRVLSAAERMPR